MFDFGDIVECNVGFNNVLIQHKHSQSTILKARVVGLSKNKDDEKCIAVPAELIYSVYFNLGIKLDQYWVDLKKDDFRFAPNISQFFGLNMRYIYPKFVVKITKAPIDGCICKICNDYCEYSKPNQPDYTFICYKCRNA